jgi:hypothetical protein
MCYTKRPLETNDKVSVGGGRGKGRKPERAPAPVETISKKQTKKAREKLLDQPAAAEPAEEKKEFRGVCFEQDLKIFGIWRNGASLPEGADVFTKDNHYYDSVKGGKVGSVYFGRGDGDAGGRLRLLHVDGPEFDYYADVKRYAVSGYEQEKGIESEKQRDDRVSQQYRDDWEQRAGETPKDRNKRMRRDHPYSWLLRDETGKQRNERIGQAHTTIDPNNPKASKKRIFEVMHNSKGAEYSHESRGKARKVVDNKDNSLEDSDFEDLLMAVLYDQILV